MWRSLNCVNNAKILNRVLLIKEGDVQNLAIDEVINRSLPSSSPSRCHPEVCIFMIPMFTKLILSLTLLTVPCGLWFILRNRHKVWRRSRIRLRLRSAAAERQRGRRCRIRGFSRALLMHAKCEYLLLKMADRCGSR